MTKAQRRRVLRAATGPEGTRGEYQMPPLDGVTVVSVEQAVAAPLASRHLADLGARVIKVERPGEGDFARHYDETVNGLSSFFVWTNRSKESVTLDLKDPLSRQILTRLIERADIFIHNLAPASARRLSIDGMSLMANNPKLIVCEISGYGDDGPLSGGKAYDLLIQAESGVLEVTGTDGTRAKVGISIADIAAGMYAFSGILMAMYRRERTGAGGIVAVAMFDALVEWMSQPLYYAHYGGRPPRRRGARHATIGPYGPFLTGDGDTVVLAVQNAAEWRRFCEFVLGDLSISNDARFQSNAERVAHADELDQIINNVFASSATTEILARLRAADVPYAHVNDLDFVWHHPQLQTRARFTEVDSPVGSLMILRPPIEGGFDSSIRPIPKLGEHTEAVLDELGIDTRTQAQLRLRGAI